jgi:hypothetical protein
MALTTRSQPDQQPYVAEIHIYGLLYLRIERLPRWLAVSLATALPAIGWWLLLR